MKTAKKSHGRTAGEAPLPILALTHGQAVWLMTELGLSHGVSAGTFNYYIKSLRSLGVPFEKGKGQSEGHRHVTYDLEEIMELAVALLLRVYGTLPDPVIEGLRKFRDRLRPIYRQAFLEATTSKRSPCGVTEGRGRTLNIEGLFLDLNIRYLAGHLVEFGPPKAISPFEAVASYATSGSPARSYLPINLSVVAASIMERTRTLPPRRRRVARAGVITAGKPEGRRR